MRSWPGYRRFAVTRVGDQLKQDGWALVTLAELALHRQLLGDPADGSATELYAQAAPLTGQQRKSARGQLELLRDAGDPTEVIDPLLRALAQRSPVRGRGRSATTGARPAERGPASGTGG